MRQRSQGGFTIIEILISLSIAAFLLVVASMALKGQSGETSFQQSTRDLQSKIEHTINQIQNGLLPNSDRLKCTANYSTGPTVATSGSTGNSGSNQDCIYLGKAIKVTAGSGTMKIYTVLGNRLYNDAVAGKKVNPRTLQQTLPVPALNVGVTETYLPTANGATLKSATYSSSGSTPTGELAGFYMDPAGTSSAQSKLLSRVYQANGNATDQTLAACIGETSGCTTPADLTDWKLCYNNSDATQTALIEVISNSQGVTTRLKYSRC